MQQSLLEWTDEELEDINEDRCVPMEMPTRVQHGDVWALGRHTLYCSDSETHESVNRIVNNHGYAMLVFTDPPYEFDSLHASPSSFAGGDNMRPVHKAIAEMGIGEFDPKKFLELLPDYFRPGMIAAYIFHSKNNAPDYYAWVKQQRDMDQICVGLDFCTEEVVTGTIPGKLKNLVCTPLVWEKVSAETGRSNAIPFGGAHNSDLEYLLFIRKNGKWNNRDKAPLAHRGRSLKHPKVKGSHPTEKPIDLIVNQLLLTTDPDDIVVDPYAGGGSTLLSCELTGRRGVVVEQLPRFCDLIVSRWEGLSGRKAVKI